jgi:hypothetical protein
MLEKLMIGRQEKKQDTIISECHPPMVGYRAAL